MVCSQRIVWSGNCVGKDSLSPVRFIFIILSQRLNLSKISFTINSALYKISISLGRDDNSDFTYEHGALYNSLYTTSSTLGGTQATGEAVDWYRGPSSLSNIILYITCSNLIRSVNTKREE